ncbi:hypothetical protein [Halorubrum salsamenti]|uniref:hypothetical protein n=1 Tax=Halorubrum salsamenti TaxID=2583990 RepID=UPI00119F0265|nr:hypothetical protein [Halorubrum salsamenti]
MNPDDIIEIFTAGIILVVGIFVIATIRAPSIANILDNVLIEIVSSLVYLMLFLVIVAMFYQLVNNT